MEESRERRLDHQGVCGVCYSIELGGDLNDTKNIYIHLGLRRPLIDLFAHNSQPKTSGVLRRVGRDGATIRERVGSFVSLIWEEI